MDEVVVKKKKKGVQYFTQDTENAINEYNTTNNFELKAHEIALLYKQRWQVELFFKWIKQHLKVKTFWGVSENAVRIQINIAIITYCLVSIVSKELKINRSIYEILQILSASLLDKTPVNELLNKCDYETKEYTNPNQLILSLF